METHRKTFTITSKRFYSNRLELLVKVLRWLLKAIKPSESVDLERLQPLISKMDKIHRTRGKVGLIIWCKNQRLALLHFLSGESTTKRIEGVSYTKDGFPRSLGTYVRTNLSNTTLLRLVLTILYSTRVLSTGKVPNTKPISDPTSVSALPDLGEYSVHFWRDLGYRPSKERVPHGLVFKAYHMTTKAGPNGQALWTSMVDFKYLLSHSTLADALKLLGGPLFKERFSLLESCYTKLPQTLYPSEGTTLRKLTYFPDMETKVRTVAILDYWSQTVLRAFHDYLFRVLRKIPQDCTFNQGSFKDRVKDWQYFYSFDLTAATDRFPIQIIATVLKGLLPDWYVNAWVHVMVGLPFCFKQGKKSEMISYSVGNPMGAYSSWNSFTIAHHYIMYWCCKKLRMNWKTAKYCILGDDVLIGDHDLARIYLEVIHSLGVEVSTVKSHSSSRLFEFAKRLFLDGEEITPFPVSALPESTKKFYLLVNLLREESRKGWSWIQGIPPTVSDMYSIVLRFNATFAARIEDRSFLTDLVIDIMRGTLPANDGLNTIIGRFELPLPVLTLKQGIAILSSTALEVFVESNPLDHTQGKPLGQMAEDLVCELTILDIPEIGAALYDIPSTIPILNLYGQVSEQYMAIAKQAYLIDTIGKGEWPIHLRALALPFTDRVFKERSSHTIIRVGAVLGDKVFRNLRNLRYSDF